MNNLFQQVLNVSLICSLAILGVLVLNKVFRKNYSRRWIYIVWLVIAIRLVLPVNVGVIKIPELSLSNDSVRTNIESLNQGNQESSISFDNSRMQESMSKLNMNGILWGENILKGNITEDSMLVGTISMGSRMEDSKSEGSAESSEASDGSSTVNYGNHYFAEMKNRLINFNNIPASVRIVLASFWLVGMIFFLSYHMLAYRHYIKKLKRNSNPVKNEALLELFQSLCNEAGVKKKIQLITSDQVTSPILVGFITSYIVMPARELTMEQCSFILKHELVHYKHRDLYYKFLLLLANSIHWFNPLVYYMVQLVNNDIELYCDECVISERGLVYRENYSKALLYIIGGERFYKNNMLLSNGFTGKKEQLKNRFYQIMNGCPKKRGTRLILVILCLIIVMGNLVNLLFPVKVSGAVENPDQMNIIETHETDELTEKEAENVPERLENMSNVLVLGIHGTEDESVPRADSILLVSVNPETKKLTLTSFLRDQYLEIPGHDKDKLGAAYPIGGAELMEQTIESNYGLIIDHTVTIHMEGFENIINIIGGVKIELTEEEAYYLNHTNYISKMSNRNVIAGEQILNGDQALGYVRIRKVANLHGEREDIGRCTRLRSLLLSVIEGCKEKEVSELLQLVTLILPNISSDVSMEDLLHYLYTALQEDVKTETLSIPIEDSYTEKVENGMFVLDVDLEKNKIALEQIRGVKGIQK